MKVKIFTKRNCPNCPLAKELGQKLLRDKKISVEFYDVEEAEGLAESQFYSVMATPTIVVCDSEDNVLKAYRGEVPDMKNMYIEKNRKELLDDFGGEIVT